MDTEHSHLGNFESDFSELTDFSVTWRLHFALLHFRLCVFRQIGTKEYMVKRSRDSKIIGKSVWHFSSSMLWNPGVTIYTVYTVESFSISTSGFLDLSNLSLKISRNKCLLKFWNVSALEAVCSHLSSCPDLVADVVAAAIGWIHIRFLALLQRKAAAQRGLRQTHIAVLQEKKTSVKHDSPLKVVKKYGQRCDEMCCDSLLNIQSHHLIPFVSSLFLNRRFTVASGARTT